MNTKYRDLQTVVGNENVSRETFDRLSLYENELKRWNTSINLVAPATVPDIWTRHILDSAQIWPMRPERIAVWVDIGSGAGFPGLVIAALAQGSATGMRVVLVERDQRKSAFLRNIARQMDVSIQVLDQDARKIAPLEADMISARAVASLTDLLEITEPHSKTRQCLFLKGEKAQLELTEAAKCWNVEAKLIPSKSNSSGRIIKIENFERV